MQAAKRNPGLARARGLLRPVLFVTASEFHGVPFGPVPAGLFRYGVGPVMVWLFRFCKRPNGMEVGLSLLSLWLVAAKEAGQTESGTRKGTWVVEACVVRHCQRVSRGSVWPRIRRAFSLQLGARYGVAFSVLQAAKRNGGGVFVAFVVVGVAEKSGFIVASVVARSVGRAPSIPFG